MNTIWLKDGKMPEAPKKPGNKIIVPIGTAIPLMKPEQKFGWNPSWNGIVNPDKGRFEHMAVVDVDENGKPVGFSYDITAWYDGKQLADGITQQTEVIAPIMLAPADPENPNSPMIYWVLFYWEWRMTMMKWVASVPGGFESAKEEALEEAGLVVKSYDSHDVCFNRANVMTTVRIGFGTFEFGPDPKPDKLEAIFTRARYAIPLADFPLGPDAHVNEAVAYAREKLGCKKAMSVDEALKALEAAIAAEKVQK